MMAVAGTKTAAATEMAGDTDNNQLKGAAKETTARRRSGVDDEGMQDRVVDYNGEGTTVARVMPETAEWQLWCLRL